MKQVFSKLCLVMLVCCVMLLYPSSIAYAEDDLDSLTSTESEDTSTYTDDSSQYNQAFTDNLQDYTPVTSQNMASVSRFASPLVNIIGTAIGFILAVVSALIFFVSACDLLYIGVPFLRGYLNPNYVPQGAAGGGGMGGGMSPMGGMGGMGRYGMSGGMMGGGMGGGAPQAPMSKAIFGHCWVSDECLACVPAMPQQPQGGGMGMGMGMGGGMGMGMQQPAPMPSTKSLIMQYFKKRTFFIIVFTVASIMLTSSIFTQSGLNLASLLFKIVTKINEMVGNASI